MLNHIYTRNFLLSLLLCGDILARVNRNNSPILSGINRISNHFRFLPRSPPLVALQRTLVPVTTPLVRSIVAL